MVHNLFLYLQESLNPIQRFDLNNVTRWFDLIQNLPPVAAKLPPIPIRANALLLQQEKEKETKSKPEEAGAAVAKKEKEAAPKPEKTKPAAKPAEDKKALAPVPTVKPEEKKQEAAKPAEKKEEKKEEKKPEKEKKEPAADKPKPPSSKGAPKDQKEPKEPKGKKAAAAAADEQSDISRCDIRVGKILSIEAHPDAETLFVEKIDLGESTGPRTIVSGLRKFYKPEDLNGRMVVVLTNLKPAKVRGIESAGMVLAASNADHTQVEVLDPPAGVAPGDRITFEGETAPPEAQLNPKKGVFERVAAELKTNDQCVATYKGSAFTTPKGIVKVATLKGAGIK